MLSDIAKAWAWECSIFAHICGHILGDVADMVAVNSKHLDGIGVIGIVWFCFQGTFELSEIFVNIVLVRHASNIELYNVKLAIILWPDAYVVAFVLDAEVLESLDRCIRVTNRVAVVVEEIEVAWLIGDWRLFRMCWF